MFEYHHVTVNVNDILAIQRNTISGLPLLANSFRKQPVQNRKVNVYWSKLPAVEFQVFCGKAVLEFVELDESAVTQNNTKMLSAQSPKIWNVERTRQVICL
jgi:hypothetical protein